MKPTYKSARPGDRISRSNRLAARDAFEPNGEGADPAPSLPLMDTLKLADPEIFAAIASEEVRQREDLELIASEN